MLAEARKLSESERLEITFMHGRAEGTGLPDASADVVTAGQCWHWFDQAAALREVQRLLGDSGRLVIAYFDWLPLPGNVVAATETLIEQYNPEWRMGGGCGMHPHYLADLSVAGLSRIETFSYDLDVAYSIEAWRGRIRASAGIVALLDDEAERFDADLGGLLSEGFGEVLAVPHRVWVVVADH